jgi:hypothetical protein
MRAHRLMARAPDLADQRRDADHWESSRSFPLASSQVMQKSRWIASVRRDDALADKWAGWQRCVGVSSLTRQRRRKLVISYSCFADTAVRSISEQIQLVSYLRSNAFVGVVGKRLI